MQYRSHQSGIESNGSFSVKIEDLIREIVIQNDIPYYRIESGVEHYTVEGAEDTTMPVIRIITYFEDTVNKISHILHEEFDVDIERSVDKKKIRIETFAYKNINYTATLKADRREQTVYKRSANKKFEIQICSMLQDAWTGIEKELGYDTTFVPDEAKRDFYRVGALLEMADIEFLKIRTELGQRKLNKSNEVIQQAAAPIKTEETKIEIPVVNAPTANKNSFVEHLQSVAKEVTEVTPVAQPAPVVTFTPPVAAPPVMEQPVVVAPSAPVIHQPVVAAPAPPPAPVMEQPVVVAPPAPVIHQPVVVAPAPPPAPVMEQPAVVVAEPAPVMTVPAPHVAVAVPAPQTIAPQRVMPPAAPSGIAPKPAIIPSQEPIGNSIAASANINIDSLRELAQSINHIEPKIEVPVEVPQPVAKHEPPAPVVVAPPPVVAEVPKPAPPPEVIPSVTDKFVPLPQAPVPPVAEQVTLNVNGSGAIETTPEVKENSNVKNVPFYNEAAKPAKNSQLDENAQMTDLTLREYVMNSKLLKEVDQQIAERAGAKINSDIDIEGDVERLRFLKVYTLKQLHERIMDNKNDIVAFAEKWIGKDNGGSFDSGISLFYLEYLLVGKKNDPAFAVEYVVKFISDNDYSARYIIPTYNSIHNTEAPNFSHLTLKA